MKKIIMLIFSLALVFTVMTSVIACNIDGSELSKEEKLALQSQLDELTDLSYSSEYDIDLGALQNRIKITSSDSSRVEITAEGKIKIVGLGLATVTITDTVTGEVIALKELGLESTAYNNAVTTQINNISLTNLDVMSAYSIGIDILPDFAKSNYDVILSSENVKYNDDYKLETIAPCTGFLQIIDRSTGKQIVNSQFNVTLDARDAEIVQYCEALPESGLNVLESYSLGFEKIADIIADFYEVTYDSEVIAFDKGEIKFKKLGTSSLTIKNKQTGKTLFTKTIKPSCVEIDAVVAQIAQVFDYALPLGESIMEELNDIGEFKNFYKFDFSNESVKKDGDGYFVRSFYGGDVKVINTYTQEVIASKQYTITTAEYKQNILETISLLDRFKLGESYDIGLNTDVDNASLLNFAITVESVEYTIDNNEFISLDENGLLQIKGIFGGRGTNTLTIKDITTGEVLCNRGMFVVSNNITTQIRKELCPDDENFATATIPNSMLDMVVKLEIEDNVNAEKDATTIFAMLKNLEVLRYENSGLSDLSFLKNNTKLKELYLSGNNISDVLPIKDLVNIQVLDLSLNNISDCESLRILTSNMNMQGIHPNLDLNLSRNNISDISTINSLYGIQKLNLSYNKLTSISNIDGFGDMSALVGITDLDLSYNEINPQDFFVIKHFSSLRSLNLSGLKVNLGDIPSLKNLQYLDLSNSEWYYTQFTYDNAGNIIGDISEQQYEARVKAREKFKECTSLIGLNMESADVNDNDLEYIYSITTLENLNLADNLFENLTKASSQNTIANLSALTTLDISDNRNLVNIKGIEGVTTLATLIANNCPSIEDTSYLKEINALSNMELINSLSVISEDLYDTFMAKINSGEDIEIVLFNDSKNDKILLQDVAILYNSDDIKGSCVLANGSYVLPSKDSNGFAYRKVVLNFREEGMKNITDTEVDMGTIVLEVPSGINSLILIGSPVHTYINFAIDVNTNRTSDLAIDLYNFNAKSFYGKTFLTAKFAGILTIGSYGVDAIDIVNYKNSLAGANAPDMNGSYSSGTTGKVGEKAIDCSQLVITGDIDLDIIGGNGSNTKASAPKEGIHAGQGGKAIVCSAFRYEGENTVYIKGGNGGNASHRYSSGNHKVKTVNGGSGGVALSSTGKVEIKGYGDIKFVGGNGGNGANGGWTDFDGGNGGAGATAVDLLDTATLEVTSCKSFTAQGGNGGNGGRGGDEDDWGAGENGGNGGDAHAGIYQAKAANKIYIKNGITVLIDSGSVGAKGKAGNPAGLFGSQGKDGQNGKDYGATTYGINYVD